MELNGVVFSCDLDDTLIPYYPAFVPWLNRKYGTAYKVSDIWTHALYKIYGVSEDEIERDSLVFYKSPEHAAIEPMPGAVEALGIMRRRGADMLVNTARPQQARVPTTTLFSRRFRGMLNGYCFTNHRDPSLKGEITKREACLRNGVRIHFEDAPVHAEDVAPVVEKVILLRTPWNTDYEPRYSNICVVNSWYEVIAKYLQ